ncbi:hypothetical protein Hanom_Chr06g00542361 [Helianthus anomalus]
MNGRNKKNGPDIGKIGALSIRYRSYIGQISDNIVDIIGTDILNNILYHYLGRGPITDIALIYRDVNYIDNFALIRPISPVSYDPYDISRDL